VRVERYEDETTQAEVARRLPQPELRRYVTSELEGWRQTRGPTDHLREVPFPGIPLILNLGSPWHVSKGSPTDPARRYDSFVAGLHTRPSFVEGDKTWACIELRLTPLGAHRLIRMPMHELANETLALEELLPGSEALIGRLREADSWVERFDLVEAFLVRRLADVAAPSPAIEWSWAQLHQSHGRISIAGIADELGWSHRRLISRFREQLGLTPKAVARVIRFDRAVQLLGGSGPSTLASVAYDCGYFDQAHMNRDFRELAGTTPAELLARRSTTGAVAA
jgi:AraC-like DNA-binding protein